MSKITEWIFVFPLCVFVRYCKQEVRVRVILIQKLDIFNEYHDACACNDDFKMTFFNSTFQTILLFSKHSK